MPYSAARLRPSYGPGPRILKQLSRGVGWSIRMAVQAVALSSSEMPSSRLFLPTAEFFTLRACLQGSFGSDVVLSPVGPRMMSFLAVDAFELPVQSILLFDCVVREDAAPRRQAHGFRHTVLLRERQHLVKVVVKLLEKLCNT